MSYVKTFTWILLTLFFPLFAQSQCTTYAETPRGEDAKDAHSVYRQAMKMEDWSLAFDQWKVAYEIAPAADGTSYAHFLDGADLYVEKYNATQDEALKKEYAQKALDLFDQCVACYEQKKLSVKDCNSDECIDQQIGIILGRKAFQMFYNFSTPYAELLSTLQKSLELAGNKSEYTVIRPFATVLTYQFSHDKVDVATARQNVLDLQEMVDFNIENNQKYAQYYEQEKLFLESQFAKIEGVLFDWKYFKDKFKPMYEADPDNFDNIKMMIAKLKGQDCPSDDEFLVMLEKKWAAYAEEENAKLQAELEAKYPNLAAKRLFDEGNYEEAIAKYKEAIDQTEEDEKSAEYYLAIASIQFRKLNQYSVARENARKAAKLRSNWGRPYMLIGDMYGSTARNCGDPLQQGLAILAAIEKYRYAKSIDDEVAADAQERINAYWNSRPSRELGFQQSINDGDKVRVDCWIGEIVTVSYK